MRARQFVRSTLNRAVDSGGESPRKQYARKQVVRRDPLALGPGTSRRSSHSSSSGPRSDDETEILGAVAPSAGRPLPHHANTAGSSRLQRSSGLLHMLLHVDADHKETDAMAVDVIEISDDEDPSAQARPGRSRTGRLFVALTVHVCSLSEPS